MWNVAWPLEIRDETNGGPKSVRGQSWSPCRTPPEGPLCPLASFEAGSSSKPGEALGFPGRSLPRGRSPQHPAALGAQLITLCCRPSSCWARLPWSCPLGRRGDRGTRRCELAKRGIWKGGPGGRGGLGLPGFRPVPGASSRLEPPLLPPGAPRGVHTHKGGAPGSDHPVTQQRKLVRPRAGPLGNPLPPSRPPGRGAGLGLF